VSEVESFRVFFAISSRSLLRSVRWRRRAGGYLVLPNLRLQFWLRVGAWRRTLYREERREGYRWRKALAESVGLRVVSPASASIQSSNEHSSQQAAPENPR